MTPAEAAWVRDHAWTSFMRRQLWSVAGTGYSRDAALAASLCECMVGICAMCRQGKHKFCDRRTVAPQPEWWIENRPLDYIKPTPVWYADRACRSLCSCCPGGPPVRFELVPLFDLTGKAITP